ncbi:MAG: CvpA family protein [candidate division WOR-3 bacterium]
MSWIDYVIALILLIMGVIWAYRGREGSGLAFFDMTALIATTWATHRFALPISDSIGLDPTLVFIVLYVVIGFLLILASTQLYNALFTQSSYGFRFLNCLISFVFGLIAGWALCYGLLDVLTIAVEPGSTTGQAIQSSSLAPEILTFRSIAGGKARLDSTAFRPRELWEEEAPPSQSR